MASSASSRPLSPGYPGPPLELMRMRGLIFIHTGWGLTTYSHSAYQCVELLCRHMQTKASANRNHRRTRIYLRGMLSGVYGQYYIIIGGG